MPPQGILRGQILRGQILRGIFWQTRIAKSGEVWYNKKAIFFEML